MEKKGTTFRKRSPQTFGEFMEHRFFPDKNVLREAHAIVGTLADQARLIALRYFRKRLRHQRKADLTPVTVADRKIERELRRLIQRRFPSHGILGEEMTEWHASNPYVWVLDPIDGTRSFITGIPLFGTLIALAYEGKPILGVIEIPGTQERWTGSLGSRTLLNGKPCRTSRCTNICDARLCTTTPDTFTGSHRKKLEKLKSIVSSVRYGGDCYIFGMLALGFCDIVIECGLKPYDFMALVPVIEGAGGVITDWHGSSLNLNSDGNVIASATKELHSQALEILG